MRAATLLFALLLLAPVAMAQIPSACGPVPLTAPASPAPVEGGQGASLVVTVANSGSVTATVTVSASTTSSGWTLDETEQTQDVAAGGEGEFTFRLTASPEATGDATVNFASSGSCDPPVGPGLQATGSNGSVVVLLAAPEGFRIPGLDAIPFPLEYLVGGIVLVGIATAIPFFMRRAPRGVAATCPEPLKMVKPGRGTSFPIELRNHGAEQTTAQFEVGPVPEGWSAFMPLPEVQLAGKESRSLWLMVRSPQGAAVGQAADVELRLRGAQGKPALVRVRAEVAASAPE